MVEAIPVPTDGSPAVGAAVDAAIERGITQEPILASADARAIDLIVMATHCR